MKIEAIRKFAIENNCIVAHLIIENSTFSTVYLKERDTNWECFQVIHSGTPIPKEKEREVEAFLETEEALHQLLHHPKARLKVLLATTEKSKK